MPFVSSITISLLPKPINFPNWFLFPGFELLQVSLILESPTSLLTHHLSQH